MADIIPFSETNGIPRIRDIDLGGFLGMAQPLNIRQTIAKYLREKKLNDSDVITQRVTIGSMAEKGTPGRKSDHEYWLSEGAAIFVAARAETDQGTKVLQMLIAVFDDWKKSTGAVSRLLGHYFSDAPKKLTDRLFPGLIRALLLLRSREIDEPQVGNPAWGPMLASLVYSWAIKAHGQQEHRRSLNPVPTGSSTDYAWLTGDGLDACKHVIQTGIDFARAADTYDDWKYQMERSFGGKPVQLRINPFARKLQPKKR
jgi:hypothetical protein